MNPDETRLIVGLGNPGLEYENTRHNVGFILLDNYITELNVNWNQTGKFIGKMAKIQNYILLKPMTSMNNSGDSVSKVINYFNIPIPKIIVIHDDVDLIFGDVRVQFASGSAGHKGVESIIEQLGSKNFWRVRVGIGRPENANIETENWVLTPFTQEELNFINGIDLSQHLELIK